MDDFILHITLNRDEHDNNSNIAKLSQQLRNDLLKLNVKDVDYLLKENSMNGTKAGDIISWETLIVTLAASGGVITTLVNFIIGWLKRNEGRSVVLELNGNKLEVSGLSASEQKELIETWLKRNSGILLK